MIKIKNLVYHYGPGEAPVLDQISLDIGEGEFVGIIGPNGCGKSTLIRHFNALLQVDRGSVEVDGLDAGDPSDLAEIRLRVGMVFQNPDNQIVGMTVEEDVSFGPGNLNLAPAQIRKRVEEALAVVGLQEYAHRSSSALSGGQKQLLAIAGVLAMEPRYIVLDEPTSSLDLTARRHLLEVLCKLHRQGIAIIHVTHHVDEIVGADRIIVLDQGKIALDGRPDEVFCRVDWLKARGIAVPQVTELMWRMRQRGVDVRAGIITIDDACAELLARMERWRS
jgi:biotin transport system ATP-binding protein/energy-coupling factor transport system ATP-binding protein